MWRCVKDYLQKRPFVSLTHFLILNATHAIQVSNDYWDFEHESDFILWRESEEEIPRRLGEDPKEFHADRAIQHQQYREMHLGALEPEVLRFLASWKYSGTSHLRYALARNGITTQGDLRVWASKDIDAIRKDLRYVRRYDKELLVSLFVLHRRHLETIEQVFSFSTTFQID